MKFSDILDLARQGYKPSDIRELLSMDTEHEPKHDPEHAPEPDPEPEPKHDPDPKHGPDPSTEPDYKKMYEETLKRLDALQKANQRHPIDDKKDDVNDIIREVFY